MPTKFMIYISDQERPTVITDHDPKETLPELEAIFTGYLKDPTSVIVIKSVTDLLLIKSKNINAIHIVRPTEKPDLKTTVIPKIVEEENSVELIEDDIDFGTDEVEEIVEEEIVEEETVEIVVEPEETIEIVIEPEEVEELDLELSSNKIELESEKNTEEIVEEILDNEIDLDSMVDSKSVIVNPVETKKSPKIPKDQKSIVTDPTPEVKKASMKTEANEKLQKELVKLDKAVNIASKKVSEHGSISDDEIKELGSKLTNVGD